MLPKVLLAPSVSDVADQVVHKVFQLINPSMRFFEGAGTVTSLETE